jgi:hypothetical protein
MPSATAIVAVSRACLEGNGGSGCTLAHSLPWYFGLLLVTVWVVLLVATASLVRWRFRIWRDRRRAARVGPRALNEGHGTDIERY